MQQTKDILNQEPEVQPVGCANDAEGYLVYLSLDYLHDVFCEMNWHGDAAAQQKFIEEMQDGIADVLARRSEKSMIFSWLWTDNEGCTRHAIEVVPTKKVQGVQIVTPDMSGYMELNKKIQKLEVENAQLKHQIRTIGEELRKRDLLSERTFRAYFDLQPEGLVERFQKEKEE